MLFFGVFYPTPTFRIRSAAVILCEIPAPLVQHEYLAAQKAHSRELQRFDDSVFQCPVFVCVFVCGRNCTRLYLVQWHFGCSASQYAIKVSENVHLFECFFFAVSFCETSVQACPSIDSDDTFFHAIQSFSALPNLTLSGVFFCVYILKDIILWS